MAKTYHIHLKGFVGNAEFNADYVDYVLAKHIDEEVNVLIDSLGGSIKSALSIAASFARHGNVNVHFAGMNASAATVASLGAKRISMDKHSLYLAHQCSVEFFQWGQLNADELQEVVKDVSQTIRDLNKIDNTIAQYYADRTKHTTEELYELMKEAKWLNADEALKWGLIDEITDWQEPKPKVSNKVVKALMAADMPVPDSVITLSLRDRLLNAFEGLFADYINENQITEVAKMNLENCPNLANVLGAVLSNVEDNSLIISVEQAQKLEDSLKLNKEQEAALNAQIDELKGTITKLNAQIENLQKLPAAVNLTVVADKNEVENPYGAFVETYKNASNLFNSLP